MVEFAVAMAGVSFWFMEWHNNKIYGKTVSGWPRARSAVVALVVGLYLSGGSYLAGWAHPDSAYRRDFRENLLEARNPEEAEDIAAWFVIQSQPPEVDEAIVVEGPVFRCVAEKRHAPVKIAGGQMTIEWVPQGVKPWGHYQKAKMVVTIIPSGLRRQCLVLSGDCFSQDRLVSELTTDCSR